MSRTGGMTGAGGYGGISTLNQRDVRPRYAPHMTIFKYVDHMMGAVEIKCLDCGMMWSHPRGNPKGTFMPATCEKPEPVNKTNRGDRRMR